MRVEYSGRAIADLHKMAEDSRAYGKLAAQGLDERLRQVIAHLAEHPQAAPKVENRPGVHVLPLIRYPYKVFYRVFEDRVLILHIRHTSRRPWKGR
jgi:plasmid stabilization system protein ParE